MNDNMKKIYRMITTIIIFPFYLIFTVFLEIVLGFAIGDKWDKLANWVNKQSDKTR